ncbi:YchF/TatD family DNA exonuclease [Treponema phagedenis]|uniref:Hydrolase, TatD family n=1 Tax=Treponema phagedenis TaxID=162 RepID=A0A0B7GR35_TREPH|nr:TatD family hydrolase [Treponema phagedenis]EFW39327.1 hydrolase, TatD family [Treponema phagedenis F0421]NVP24617.1 TatD family hydrolase [Treponema phagedenis]QEJ94622.1 YchF/TatD family DNA exonuclease [Treponema phagedenis]QEJ97629.1 YchF/TatD family DNA exonuclease [Treponema phagedenis]QEK00596.1 YchF/TatD family DNA exonuclease [Treponema phagedenis]
MQIFDTHAHIGLIHSDPIEQLRVVQEARRASVTRILSICNSLHDFAIVYETLQVSSSVYHAIGVSPSEVTAPGKDWIQTIEKGLSLPNVVAVGETGLDYCKKYGDKRSQIELFITQLDIASKAKVPVVIHNREAGKDVLDILAERIPDQGGIMHCYSEDAEYARLALDLPVYFSFAGNLTYRSARNLHETVLTLPLDRILVESESPFMPPAVYRNKRNKPANTVKTVEFMAELLDMDMEELAAQLWKNSCTIFNIPE